MKKYIPTFFLLCIVACTSFSCIVNTEKGVSFDIATFNAQKEKWQASGIKEYLFEYEVGPDFDPSEIKGSVSVKTDETIAVIESKDRTKYPDRKVSKDDKYYFENIDKIFDLIYSEYEYAFKTINSGDYEYIEIVCTYDSKYGYPNHIYILAHGGTKYKPANGAKGSSNGYYNFRMKKFSAE